MKHSLFTSQIAGFALMIASALPYLILLVLPIMSISQTHIMVYSTVLIAASEVFFAVGVLLVGKEGYKVLKQRFFGWMSQGIRYPKTPSKT